MLQINGLISVLSRMSYSDLWKILNGVRSVLMIYIFF